MRASLILVGLAWLIPFLLPHHHFPLTSFYGEWAAFALGLAAAFLLLRREAWRDAGLPLVVLAPVGLILVLGVQVALGRVPYSEQALTATLYLVWAALVVQLGCALRAEAGIPDVAGTLAWFLLAGGLLAALAGLVQHYKAWDVLAFLITAKAGPGVYGNLAQPNHFAAYITAGLASAGYLFARERIGGGVAGAYALLLTVVLALSGSRSPWLYFLAFAVLAALAQRRGAAGSGRLAAYGLGLFPAFVLAQLVAGMPLLQPYEGELVTSAERLFESASGPRARLQLAHEAWQMALAAPWLGAGWGQFPSSHFEYLAATGSAIVAPLCNHAHNIVLHLLAETGLAGALAVAVPLGVWLYDLRGVRLDPEWWWLLAIAAVIGLHSLLEYPLWYAYFLGIAALLLGLGARRALELQRVRAARATAALILLAGALNLLAVLGPYRDFERLVFDPQQRAARGMSDDDFAAALVRMHREPVLVPYVELLLAHFVPVTADRLPEKLELVGRAASFAPVDVVLYRHAHLLALAHRGEEAQRRLAAAMAVYPRELRKVLPELRELARRHPGEFTPLLELAVAKSAEPRATDASF